MAAKKATSRRSGTLADKKVLVCIGTFSEGLEAYYIVYRLVEEGIEPIVAAPQAGMVHTVVHDFEPQYSNYTEKAGYLIEATTAFRNVNLGQVDGVIIPGGRGPEEIRQDKHCLKIVRQAFEKGIPVGAMCHGPQVVTAAVPVTGRRIAAYSGIQPDLELAGAKFVDEAVVVDGNLITSRGWPDLPYFMPAFLNALASE